MGIKRAWQRLKRILGSKGAAGTGLSDTLLSGIVGQWLGQDAQLTPDLEQRLSRLLNAATLVAQAVETQLAIGGAREHSKWGDDRPFILGYVSGLSHRAARHAGEESEWPALIVSHSALSFLMRHAWDEEAVYNECRQLVRSDSPPFGEAMLLGVSDFDEMFSNPGFVGSLAKRYLGRLASR